MPTSPARLLRPLPLLALGLALALGGCGAGGTAGTGGDDPPPACGFVPGQVTTNVGSSAGGNYSFGPFCGYAVVTYNNINGTFSQLFNGDFATKLVDMGDMCLEEATVWPGGGTSNGLAVFIGHTYIVELVQIKGPPASIGTTCYARFTVDAYDQGVLTLTYVSHL